MRVDHRPQLKRRPWHITRFIKRGGKIVDPEFFRNKPFTRSRGTRMGKAKARRRMGVGREAGRIMFEMAGVDEATAKEALGLAAHKLPIPTKFVSRAGGF